MEHHLCIGRKMEEKTKIFWEGGGGGGGGFFFARKGKYSSVTTALVYIS